MQFRLRTLFILTAVICVYCGVLNAPLFIAMPLFCAIAWVTPAYWIAGVIYARDARRAFFIGGLAGGTVPFLALVFWSLAMGIDFFDGWGYRNYGRGVFSGETQLMNMLASLVIFAPVVLAFVGGWISLAVYYGLQPPKPVPPPLSPFRQTVPMANMPPMGATEMKQGD
ncbi:MAG: hypothetical protein ACR2FY_03025 [Pirellulaceae bacterium]